MCQILLKEPHFEIPYEKFESSVINNKDGYGFTYSDNGKLVVERSVKTPDPEKLYKLITEDLSEHRVMLHLRFTTAGETILRNAHPFPILRKKKHGVDIRMAHNGTLYEYKTGGNSWESDTRNFVRSLVSPLFQRFAASVDPDKLLSDPLTKTILESTLSGKSVLTFIDSNGNTLICNETANGGKKEEGYYYSNTYSFNSAHRIPKGVASSPSNFTGQTTGKTTSLITTQSSSTKNFKDCSTKRFTEKYGLKVSDLPLLTDASIHAIISSAEGDTELLIKELLYELSFYKELSRKYFNEMKD